MFVAFDKVFTLDNILFLLKGAGLSLMIAVLALMFGLIIAIINIVFKRSNKILKTISDVYVGVIRGTPLLVQILIIYSVIPGIYTAITGKILRIYPIIIGIIAMSINSGAYQTELLRSGISGVDKGQWEAASALCLDNSVTLKKIILPQAFKIIIPPMISEFITLFKDSSLLSCIGVVELLKGSQILGINYYDVMSPYLLAMIYYLTVTVIITKIGSKIEKRLAESD